jgi:hypothetical protein
MKGRLSEFLADGFRGVLPKPFTGSELAEALQSFRDRESELALAGGRGELPAPQTKLLACRLAFWQRFQFREKRTGTAFYVTELSYFFPLAV